jgi:cyanate lyase
MADDTIERQELDRRVLLGAIGLATKLCRKLGIPLKELTGLVRVAYLRDLRAQGLSLVECAEHLDVSERTAKNLARELRQSFELPDAQHTLPTRIEFMLWRTPMSLARLKQVIHEHNGDEIADAIDVLIAQERVELDARGATPVYVPTQSVNSQLSTQWVKRIGGLNSLIDNLYQTISMRFFEEDVSESEAFARTLTFYLTPGRLDDLVELFWKVMVPRISELDQASHSEPDARSVKMTLFWAANEPEREEP